MRKKWIVLLTISSFLLGAGIVYASVMWIIPKWDDRQAEAEMEIESGMEAKDLEKMVQAYDLIQHSYVEKVEGKELIDGAIRGMVSTLGDPNSVYMDEVTAERFNESLDSTFNGIGAQIGVQEGKLVIIAPIKGSPAEKAGLKSRDEIIKIDGKSVDGLDVYEASKQIRGEKGTVVTLEIIRSGVAQPITLKITRDEVPILTVFAELKEHQEQKIGYIEITSFAEGTADDFITELEKLEEKGIDGLVIDVRGNPGGMLTSVEAILQEFVTGEKPYIQIEERSGKRNKYYSELKEKKPYPVSVLIDEGSASASEILAASLHEINGSQLIGQLTFGKGTVQQAIPLDDGSNIKLTMFKWLTPDGTWVHGNGIKPTIDIKQPKYYYAHTLQLKEPLVLDMNNENVKIAQELLQALGYGTGRNDGYFDEQTEKAVRAFQSIEHLSITGEIDENTVRKMEEKIIEAIEDEKNDLQLQVALKSFKNKTDQKE